MKKRVLLGLSVILCLIFFSGCQIKSEISKDIITVSGNDSIETDNANLDEPEEAQSELIEEALPDEDSEVIPNITEDGLYTSREDVALYIHTYNKLPLNYITKKEAQELGWNSKENTMAEILPGMSIGGDRFGNYEGMLPKEEGRSYKECDIDYVSGSRNAKRIVYSNDGLIFYTEDHYSSFEQLY